MQNNLSHTAAYDAARERDNARHTIGTVAAVSRVALDCDPTEYAFNAMTRQVMTANGSRKATDETASAHLRQALQRVTERRCAAYRHLPVSFRELRNEARAYRDTGFNRHDAARLALDTSVPYHELLRSH